MREAATDASTAPPVTLTALPPPAGTSIARPETSTAVAWIVRTSPVPLPVSLALLPVTFSPFRPEPIVTLSGYVPASTETVSPPWACPTAWAIVLHVLSLPRVHALFASAGSTVSVSASALPGSRRTRARAASSGRSIASP